MRLEVGVSRWGDRGSLELRGWGGAFRFRSCGFGCRGVGGGYMSEEYFDDITGASASREMQRCIVEFIARIRIHPTPAPTLGSSA